MFLAGGQGTRVEMWLLAVLSLQGLTDPEVQLVARWYKVRSHAMPCWPAHMVHTVYLHDCCSTLTAGIVPKPSLLILLMICILFG
jgi:hypothetical protein